MPAAIRPPDPSCASCRSFRLNGRDPVDGECRRHAPTIGRVREPTGAEWPIVMTTDLCGDYELDWLRARAAHAT